MNNQIVDLIVPEDFYKEKAILNKKQAIKKLNNKYLDKWYCSEYKMIVENLQDYVRNYIKELDEIENKVHYNREFWIKVAELNKDVLTKINTPIIVYSQDLFFGGNYNFNEFNLINKQFRFLQEIYYKGKNEAIQ